MAGWVPKVVLQVRAIPRRWRWAAVLWFAVDRLIKVVALGTVPENRRPGASLAWLLLILLVPPVGLPLFLVLGSPYVTGRRNRIQREANRAVLDRTERIPELPEVVTAIGGLPSVVRLNRQLTGFPMVSGTSEALHGDSRASVVAMAEAVDAARADVLVQFYIAIWDSTTDVFFTALARAVERGVRVRLLFDHLGSRGYPGYAETLTRMTEAGIEWQRMMPIDLLHGRARRPDLRNHRKLLVLDGERGFMGSQNMIDETYLKARNVRDGRAWLDLNVELTGQIVDWLVAVFALDWYTETGERIEFEQHRDAPRSGRLEPHQSAMQLVPSGPGFTTEPNLRMFVSLIHLAQRRLSITSPYFVPDESLLGAITTAAYRGVEVELFVSERADQFMVDHAQRSYYRALLEAGVRIHRYPAPTVLHAKHLSVDDEIAVIGSSNMDMRSFGLDYEIMLLGVGGDLVPAIRAVEDRYRAVSRELTLQEWLHEPWYRRYLDNVMRLTSDLQ